jgi:hypothetical protein
VAYIDPQALKEAGFTDEVKPRAASAVISIAGMEGSGKTTWALTAPKPLFYQSTDFGDDGIVQKAEGQIIRPSTHSYKLNIPHEYRAFVDRKESTDERRQREGMLANFVHDKFYKPFYDDFAKAIKAGVRTVVWDNAVDVWEYTRLSVYGREATNRDDLKAEANAKFREMVRLANVHGIVLVMINHLKVKFESYYAADGAVKWRPNPNEFEMQGFDKAPFLVTASLWTKFTPPDSFELTVKKCRDNAGMVGSVFPAMPFTEMMGLLIPSVESWE